MSDVLDELAGSALTRANSGYYEVGKRDKVEVTSTPFTEKIREVDHDPVIGEIKPGSPSQGRLFDENLDPAELGSTYAEGGVTGFSVLTDPDHFFGSLDNLTQVAALEKPTLMKDFVVDYSQIRAGQRLGADAVLFIQRLFARNIPSFGLEEGIEYVQDLGLEVLLETNDLIEYESALETDADMIGINNRDLRSLEVDLARTKNILSEAGKDRIIWSMSGISSRSDIKFLVSAGADAFLVGTSLARAENPESFLDNLRGDPDG